MVRDLVERVRGAAQVVRCAAESGLRVREDWAAIARRGSEAWRADLSRFHDVGGVGEDREGTALRVAQRGVHLHDRVERRVGSAPG